LNFSKIPKLSFATKAILTLKQDEASAIAGLGVISKKRL
jgi:hypothetical protein